MVKTYHADFSHSITSEVIEFTIGPGHLRDQEMTMPTDRPNASPSSAGMTPWLRLNWLLNLATRMLARALNMPEPLVHTTGAFVFAQVQAVETSIGRTLCPVRLWRQFRNWRRAFGPLIKPRLAGPRRALPWQRRAPQKSEA
jgi:hypothetical protein